MLNRTLLVGGIVRHLPLDRNRPLNGSVNASRSFDKTLRPVIMGI